MLVSGSYFPVLGIQPALGRLFAPEDDATLGEPLVVVLSHAYWQTRFGADPGVLGQPLTVNGQALTIVGVAPRGLRRARPSAHGPSVYVPITMRGLMQPGLQQRLRRTGAAYWAYLFARLKPGVTIEQARAALNVPYRAILNDVEAPLQKGMSEQTMARFRAKTRACRSRARAARARCRREAQAPLALLLGVTGVRAADRLREHRQPAARARGRARGEMAVRLSLGATRRQLIGQLLTESCCSRRSAAPRRPAGRAMDARRDPVAAAGGSGGHARPHRLEPQRAPVRGGPGARHRPALRSVPRASQHATGSRSRRSRARRPAVGRAVGGAVPHDAGDRADRAVDGAARRRRGSSRAAW